MKIYDCFTFFNELDLLDLRLATMYDHVDHFVIVEATTTFQNTPKPLYLYENWQRYSKYQDKIIHVVVDDMPLSADPWQNERHQRDAIMRGLTRAAPDDIAIIADVDELIRGSVLDQIRQDPKQVYGFRVPYFNFKFNYMLTGDNETYCIWATASRVAALSSPEDLRRSRWDLNQFAYNYSDENIQIFEHAGWHFTYLGNTEFVKQKIQSFAHNELNTDDFLSHISVEDSIANNRGFNIRDPRKFEPVALDSYFPEQLQLPKYQQYILESVEKSASDLLPK